MPTPTPPPTPTPTPTPTPSSAGGRTLLWSDEFNTDGLPDSSKWAYDTFRNSVGWYNGELQYYANARLQNSRATNGILSIKAIREPTAGLPGASGQPFQAFTSARLITQGKFSFTYGFVEVRAKLPCSQGTWPAIWMLGTSAQPWPANGEIDIMEQRGINVPSDKQTVLGTLHMSARFAGNGISASIAVPDACTAFHNYQLTWTASAIQLGVDGVVYNTYNKPANASTANWPFDQPQYLLLNLAMGGDLGGTVPAGFGTDTLQVDYVRVYQ